MNTKTIMLLAIVMGLFTTLAFYKYTEGKSTALAAEEPYVEVFAAKAPIPRNQKITPDLVEKISVPQNMLLPSAVTDLADIEGKFATTDLEQGEQILQHRVRSQTEEAEKLNRKITEGYRAVSVAVDYVQSVSNLVRPEDRVDILYVKHPAEPGKTPGPAKVLLKNVRVLAVGQALTEEASEGDSEHTNNAGVDAGSGGAYSAVTVELQPEETMTLVDAAETGKLQLILRSKIAGTKEGP
ncbi:Flp pilus assembly protein CpaB [Paenibacillus sp.]|uniref:Flp pilus assembly protein CpaB n=1 Tax=Paenibacillus sp. TaxID=58172 RepID=UPI002D2A2D24|nr:Flp pilus assembly protein CpaB [Paenibacillus sp.]HZG84286.1 Flp pilus assembly protein CpaB [Paenibacillus sp.]